MPWGAIASAGLGLLSGALNNRPQQATRTQTYERELTPDQVQSRDNYLGGAMDMINNPGAGLTPIKNGLLQDVHRQYAGAPQRLQRSAALRGFGDSGKIFENMMQFDTQRSGAMAGVGNQVAGMEIDQKNQGYQMLMNLLNQNNKSTQTGVFDDPGNMWGGSVAGLAKSPGAASIFDQLTKFGNRGRDVSPSHPGFNGG